jgi:hypothetical protein
MYHTNLSLEQRVWSLFNHNDNVTRHNARGLVTLSSKGNLLPVSHTLVDEDFENLIFKRYEKKRQRVRFRAITRSLSSRPKFRSPNASQAILKSLSHLSWNLHPNTPNDSNKLSAM